MRRVAGVARWHRGFASVALCAALASHVTAPRAQTASGVCGKEAQGSAASTAAEDIQRRALRLRELTQSLASADLTVRMATLDAMLTTCDQAVRELGYEAGFASGDQALRALTLKRKILSAGQLVVELAPPETTTKGQGVIVKRGIKRVVTIGDANPAAGTFGVARRVSGAVNGMELQVVMGTEILRARLEEGAVMTGTLTQDESSVPVRIVLR